MRNGVIGSTADSDSVSRGSSPFSVVGNLQKHFPFFIGVWLSLVERYVRDVEVAGSNPVTPIFYLQKTQNLQIEVLRFFFITEIFSYSFHTPSNTTSAGPVI